MCIRDRHGEGTVATYVPFRNGLLISAAAAIAISLGADAICYGAHADDAAHRIDRLFGSDQAAAQTQQFFGCLLYTSRCV